jgi:hypothetical protein
MRLLERGVNIMADRILHLRIADNVNFLGISAQCFLREHRDVGEQEPFRSRDRFEFAVNEPRPRSNGRDMRAVRGGRERQDRLSEADDL